MGKRSNFDRKPKDFYRTFDKRFVKPLIPHLPESFTYIEPCAGKLDLVKNLAELHAGAYCIAATDVEYYGEPTTIRDALTPYTKNELEGVDYIITNPPWTIDILHPLIVNFILTGKKVWLLFYSDWMFTKRASPYLQYCSKIVACSRGKWIEGSKNDATDNACWYLFDVNSVGDRPRLYGRI